MFGLEHTGWYVLQFVLCFSLEEGLINLKVEVGYKIVCVCVNITVFINIV